MRSATHADGTDLESWAGRLDSRSRLPELIRRLVFATTERERVLRIEFRAGEGMQLPGWDGILAIETGNPFVPDGLSGWELGTGEDPKRKATEDYEKRSEKPEEVTPAKSTFVFVTPRRWAGKRDWAETRLSEGIWGGVRAYDADDLAAWLQLAPAVHLWLSILIGKHPDGAVDIESFWADWSATTSPPTPDGLVLAGRRGAVQEILDWIKGSTGLPLTVRAESRDEALAVFAAALQTLPAGEREPILSRTVVVRDDSGWNHLTASAEPGPLILALAFDSSEAVARATRSGHRVVIPIGKAAGASPNSPILPRLDRGEAALALRAIGLTEERASDLALLARASLTSFRRKLALSPEMQRPRWASPSEGRSLLSPMLAGSWNDSQPGDREALASLASRSYEELSETLMRWVNEDDPPVRRVAQTWSIASIEDAWTLLARYLTSDDLRRFGEAVIEVLGDPDPRFEMPANERLMAAIRGKVPKHSDLLRKGLANTLAVMGAKDAPLTDGTTGGGHAARIVRGLLKRANGDWRVWATLSTALPRLAEAAPDTFLAAVEAGTAGVPPVLAQVLSEDVQAGLLWALERLAWSPEHLGRAALLLAKLARIDPGGGLSNRPQSTLREIFLLWHPQTAANLEQRLRVIDLIREREPKAAWHLLRQLLPESHGVAHPTAKPRLREWAPDGPPRVTIAEHFDAIRETVARMIRDAGQIGGRWRDLVRSLHVLPIPQFDLVVGGLASLEPEQLDPSDRTTIWEALRSLIANHRSFPQANWALPELRLGRLEEVQRRFEPSDLLAKYGWLFVSNPTLAKATPDGDWIAHDEAIKGARLEALRIVLEQVRLPGLIDFVDSVERPGECGLTIGRSELLTAEEDDLLRDHLGSPTSAHAQFARGLVLGRVDREGREWGERKLAAAAKEWSAEKCADLLRCLPYDPRTWNLTEGLGPETERFYWQQVHSFSISDAAQVERVVEKFIENGRPFTAVDLLGFRAMDKGHRLSPALVLKALEHAFSDSARVEEPPVSLRYHVPILIDVLDSAEGIEPDRIARLEWTCLQFLGRHERAPKVLHRELARNPEFFAQIIAWVFRAEGTEAGDVSEEQRERATRGYDLLQSWRTVPGADDDGSIDRERLKTWVQLARQLTGAAGRGAVADEMIGQLLSSSPSGPDGTWPHPAVREVIEEVASENLESSFATGVFNNRGMVTKRPSEGGGQERSLADKYNGFADAIGVGSPRTASMLRRIGTHYSAEARQADREAELREDLDR
jgi:hypothetical protein